VNHALSNLRLMTLEPAGRRTNPADYYPGDFHGDAATTRVVAANL
jgi:hypothetical protein